jgi:nitrogen-specific signal transduction histidine kinase/ActR/RegA family two-component response regulator
LLCVVRDTTAIARLEERARQAQKMEAIGTLAGGIAHDFNNILAAIIGYTELALLDQDEDGPVRRHLGEVMRAADRAQDLISQVMTFSRQSKKDVRPVQPVTIVKEVVRLLRAILPATIELRHDLRSSAFTMADPTQIHQVAMNLCTNAFHAMRKEGGVLTVLLEDVSLDDAFAAAHPGITPGDYVMLKVIDTGQGIAAEIRDQIFDPFFTTKGPGEGTGMGLSLIRGILEDCGGHIVLESTPGEGADFTVYLPARETDAEVRQAIGDISPSPPRKERILFVDDEETLRRVMEQMLVRMGYRVTTAMGGEEALSIFRKDLHAFDLLITDMTMPQMTGTELAEQVLALRPHMPVILLTGYSEDIDAEKAGALGIKGFLHKPVHFQKLDQLIRDILKEHGGAGDQSP